MPKFPARRATVVLCTQDGVLLGRLPEVKVSTPWWQDTYPVVEAVRAAYGVDVTVLRLLDTERPAPHGGAVTYLAEVEGDLPAAVEAELEPANVELDDQPLRLPYAKPGGPDADVAWALDALRAQGLDPAGRPRQVRTWNLSSIWELPLASGGSAWLKVVPPFFAHEGAMLRLLQGSGPVPSLLAADGPRVLLAEIPGDDRYDADPAELLRMVFRFVHLQAAWVGREAELLATGMPDWRWPALSAAIAQLVDREGATLGDADRGTLERFVATLPARIAAIDDAGVPDTFVHGDFHPGNVRGTPDAPTILDWGDCGLGNPLLDLPAFLEAAPSGHRRRIRDAWLAAWGRAVVVADPPRAAALIEPLAAARQALIYRTFLDGIEPSERRYHAQDVARWLKRTAAIVRTEAG